ncbi:MAG: hypothetical protein RBU29_01355 [bacterium]|jgi:hypothetical protein|nr:hypothetical protein [bacterium]
MTGSESLIFWSAMILLLILTLSTMEEWRKAIKKLYTRMVTALKWQPFVAYIAGEDHPRRGHRGGRYTRHAQWIESRIFPRTRRSTFK